MKDLLVATVQLPNTVGDIPRALERHVAWIERAADAGAQLVCFPECSLTGYSTDLSRATTLTSDDTLLAELESCARHRGIAVGYGYLEQSEVEGKPRVAYALASPGSRFVYRKTHLGSRECAVFSAGNELPVGDIFGVKIGVQLCWEAHIPQVTSTLRAKGAELVIMPHASGVVGDRRLDLWSRYLPARSYDNGLFVIACNALFEHDGEVRGGGLAVYGPDGLLVDAKAPEGEDMLIAKVGGVLPRETEDDSMRNISYFDRLRPELYC